MHEEDFELLYQLEETFWWFVGMRRITDAVVARKLQQTQLRILDAGCGTGFNLGYYGSGGAHDVYGLDIAATALKYVVSRGFRKVTQASITQIPLQSEGFDLVFSFDVVTQTPYASHDAAIREMHRILKPGGHLFIRVPALMWLWSPHDVQMQVHYRYTRNELMRRLSGHGFQVEWASYANAFLFPVVVVHRFLKRLGLGSATDVKPLPRGLAWLGNIFCRVLSAEATWFQSGERLPIGSSVICYARKNPS